MRYANLRSVSAKAYYPGVPLPGLPGFTSTHFASPDSPSRVLIHDGLVSGLAALHAAGYRFAVSSGHRTEAHNRRIGGEPTSDHIYGRAADIYALTGTNEALAVAALAVFGGVGFYGKKPGGSGFVHVDVGPVKAWQNAASGKNSGRSTSAAFSAAVARRRATSTVTGRKLLGLGFIAALSVLVARAFVALVAIFPA